MSLNNEDTNGDLCHLRIMLQFITQLYIENQINITCGILNNVKDEDQNTIASLPLVN